MIKLVIFDFDGTLVDTAPDLVAATNEFRLHYGAHALPESEIRNGIGTGLKDLLAKVFELNPAEEARYEKHFLEIYERHHLLQAKVYDGVLNFLEAWPHKVAILSNKTERFIHSLLKHLDLADKGWLSVVGGDTFSEKKPHPLPFEKILELSGFKKSEVLMVGDGEPDILGAKNAGITSVAAEYGYCPPGLLKALGAEHSIKNLAELLPLIQRLSSR